MFNAPGRYLVIVIFLCDWFDDLSERAPILFAVEAIRATCKTRSILQQFANYTNKHYLTKYFTNRHCLTRYKKRRVLFNKFTKFQYIYIISSQRSTILDRNCLPTTFHAEHILLNLFHAAEFVFTTSKCPLSLFLLMAGVVPVLNSITPSLPLTSLCETDSV